MSVPHLEFQDLVRVRGRRDLAFVSRVAGGDTDDESLASDDASSDGDITDQRGRFVHWLDGLPGVSSLAAHPRTDDQGRKLISSYDDDDMDVDDEPDALSASSDEKRDTKELPEGCALVVIVATGEKEVCKVDDLELLDRNFEPGMLAAWVEEGADGLKQSGMVEEVRKTVIVRRVVDITPATAAVADDATTFELPAERLGFFLGIRAGDTVVSGSWVGVIDHFQEDVYVEFSDGAIACMPGHRKALLNVDERTPDRVRPDPFTEGLYYPGQKVRSIPPVWQAVATWIRGGYSGEDEGIVKSVSVGDVSIEWVAKSMYASHNDESRKEEGIQMMRFADVTLLEGFRSLWWSVGDRGYLLEPELAEGPVADHAAPADGANGVIGTEVVEEADDGDDGDWEEDLVQDHSGAGPSSSTAMPPRRMRSKRHGGRLMKAHRRARERSAGGANVATVTDATVASASAKPEDVVQIVGTKTTADIVWQDGSRSKGVPTTSLRLLHHSDPYDFWPGTVVLRTDEEAHVPGNGDTEVKKPSLFDIKKGAVVKVNQNERTALVKWQKDSESAFIVEEEMSVYDLKIAEYEVDVGETVLHVPQSDEQREEWVGVIIKQAMGESTVAWTGGKVSAVPTTELLYITGGDDESFEGMEHYSLEGSDQPSPGSSDEIPAREAPPHFQVQDSPVYQQNWGTDDDGEDGGGDDHAVFSFLAGKEVIKRHLSSAAIRAFHRGADWVKFERSVENIGTDVSDRLRVRRFMPDGSLRRREISTDEERRLAGAFVFKVLGDLLLQFQKEKDEDLDAEVRSEEAANDEWTDFMNLVVLTFSRIMKHETEWLSKQLAMVGEKADVKLADSTLHGEKNEVEAREMEIADEQVNVPSEADSGGPASFEVLPELNVFHHFMDVPWDVTYSKGFLTVIHKEWNRLRKSLPPGMIVRACESTVDRFRAGIVGPEGTPYADVIFFFDIRLGPKYPVMPPHVWFHSHGRRLNPNLYDDGRVCLSILGTWDGDDIESWNAKTSNLLRVLLSLQALVFVEEPYYNEAGYGKQKGTKEGHTNSRMYNESALLLSMRYILQSLKVGNLPEDCRDIAISHYRKAGPKLLERCRQLVQVKGVKPAGPSSDSGDAGTLNQQPYSSVGFQRSLVQILGSLEGVFSSLEKEES